MISWRGLGYGSAGSAFKTFTVLRDILVLKSRGIPLQGKEGRVLRMSVLQESPISLSLLREGGIKRLGNNTVHFSLSQSRVREKKFLVTRTKVKPTQVKTRRQVHRFARTSRVTRNTVINARPILRNSSSEITWKGRLKKC